MGVTPEQLESELNTGEATTQEVANEPVQEPAQTADKTIEQKIADTWDKDQRYEKSWKKDPNNLYKSYRELEKVYPTTKAEAEKYRKLFTEAGIEPDTLPNMLKEYQELKSPDRRENQLASYLDNYLKNDLYKQTVLDFFGTLEKKELQARYGENLPDEVLAKLKDLDEFKQKSEKEASDREFGAALESTKSVLAQETTKNETYAKQYGIEYDDQTHNDLMTYCRENRIPPSQVHIVFKALAQDAIIKANEEKVRAKTHEEIVKQRKSGVLVNTQASPASKPTNSFRESVKASGALDRILGRVKK